MRSNRSRNEAGRPQRREQGAPQHKDGSHFHAHRLDQNWIAIELYIDYIDVERKLKKESMMRVSRVQAAKNRETVIDVASRLFREHGFDGIGLKDLMKDAGLTQGAFYKQFASKEDLAAQASERAFESAARRWSAAAEANPEDPLRAVVAFYLSPGHRKEKRDGCPMVALGADAARHGAEVKAPFEAGIKAHLEFLGRLLADADGEKPDGKAMAVLSTMVGALVLSRAVNDNRLSKQLLDAAAESVLAAYRSVQRRT